MAQSDSSLTPEQRLLKLIESGQTPDPAKDSGKGAPERTVKPGSGAGLGAGFSMDSLTRYFSPSYLQGRISYLQENWKNLLQPPKFDEFNVKKINSILKVVIAVLVFFFSISIISELQNFKKDAQAYTGVAQKPMADILVAEPKVFEESFFDEIARRNIFVPIDKRVGEKKGKSEFSMKLLEITQQLKLVGISIHPTEAKRTFCMIEDLKKNMTCFLRTGDSISGLKVEKINADNVVLTCQDERIELR